MLVFDISVGAGEPTRAFRDAGDEIVTYDMDTNFDGPLISKVMSLTAEELIAKHGKPDFVWMSPPCVTYSLLALRYHWNPGRVPKSEAAVKSNALIAHLRSLLEGLQPTHGFIIENPRGLLRKLPMLQGIELRTVTYCQYGDTRMKPTDLWGSPTNWWARPACGPNRSCHDAAPRGTSKGTMALKSGAPRAFIPYDLGAEIRASITGEGNSFLLATEPPRKGE